MVPLHAPAYTFIATIILLDVFQIMKMSGEQPDFSGTYTNITSSVPTKWAYVQPYQIVTCYLTKLSLSIHIICMYALKIHQVCMHILVYLYLPRAH